MTTRKPHDELVAVAKKPVLARSESLALARDFWNSAAERYDQSFSGTSVGKLWRAAVWRELDAQFLRGASVLEINCGTGLDAIHLAQRGVRVLACDISTRMIDRARQGADAAGVSALLDFCVLATEHLAVLDPEPLFDGAFSNFSGLNCVIDIAAVGRNFARLLKPNAPLLLCVLGTNWALGNSWRRLQKSQSPPASPAKRAGVEIYRPSPAEIATALSPYFALYRQKGIGITVPPSYMEPWAARFPRITSVLGAADFLFSGLPPFRSLGGCTLLEFVRTARREVS